MNSCANVHPLCNTSFLLGSPESTTQTASQSIQPFFSRLTAECRPALPCMSFPLKIAPSHGRSGTPCNTWFLGPTWVHIPNGISIGSAVFVQLPAFTTCRPFLLPLKLPLSMRDLNPCLIHGSPESSTQTALRSVLDPGAVEFRRRSLVEWTNYATIECLLRCCHHIFPQFFNAFRHLMKKSFTLNFMCFSHDNTSRVPCTKVLSESTSRFLFFTPSDRSRCGRQASDICFSNFATREKL